jgi:hypothetical protein
LYVCKDIYYFQPHQLKTKKKYFITIKKFYLYTKNLLLVVEAVDDFFKSLYLLYFIKDDVVRRTIRGYPAM